MNVIFEGLPGAGKTTIIEELTNNNSLNIKVLNEFLENISGDKRDVEYFLANERKKDQIMSEKSFDLILSDRFWHSTLVFNAVSCNVKTLEELLALYRIIYKNRQFEKSAYVFMEVTSKVSNMRHRNIGIDDCLWFNETFSQKAEIIYSILYENLELFSPNLLGKIKINTRLNDLASTKQKIESFLECIAT